jgi:hypothetical protein
LLANYGIKSLIEDAAKLKAVHIPDLLQSAFGVPLTPKDVEQFNKIREERNNVAHGSAGALDMRKVTAMSIFLRKLAFTTADHLSEHSLSSRNMRRERPAPRIREDPRGKHSSGSESPPGAPNRAEVLALIGSAQRAAFRLAGALGRRIHDP